MFPIYNLLTRAESPVRLPVASRIRLDLFYVELNISFKKIHSILSTKNKFMKYELSKREMF
ncbi:hypothetical protein [Leptospira noguchii]|uniref:hypothetical protein n=1 Tax=Leptospira noguchii TaxID=28182 RepID=UPI0015EF3B01|nr:hypothetical protein [Leptospira noguchii]UOG52001.1 hypothetical protein MAL09_15370 [Leptospira noguchii]